MDQLIGLASTSQLWPAAPRSETLQAYWAQLLASGHVQRGSALLQAAQSILDATEAHGQALAAQSAENAYHNREHVSDVLIALGILLDHMGDALTAEQKTLLILAMIAHDYGHNGSINRTAFELEHASFQAVRPMLDAAAVPVRQQARVRRLILLTDPHCQKWIAALTPGIFATQARLAVEADLMASLMPARGFYLGARLAHEQMQNAVPHAPLLETLEGRAKFLSAVRCDSPAAQRLGLEQLRLAQLTFIDTLSAEERLRPWTPQWGEVYANAVRELLMLPK